MGISANITMTNQQQINFFIIFQKVIAGVCLCIPLILRATDHASSFRPSISNYVYMQHSYVFGMLLTIGAMMFMFNGALYFNTEDKLDISDRGKFYNLILGIALLLVVCFPHLQFPVEHYTVAIIFFFGNAVVTALFHNKKDSNSSILLAIATVAGFIFVYANIFSLLCAEWISLACIAGHFWMQANSTQL